MNPATPRPLPAAARLAGTALTATQAAHAASATSTPPPPAPPTTTVWTPCTRAGEGRTSTPAAPRAPLPHRRTRTPRPGHGTGTAKGTERGAESGTESDEGTGRISPVPEWAPTSLPMPQRPDRHQAARWARCTAAGCLGPCADGAGAWSRRCPIGGAAGAGRTGRRCSHRPAEGRGGPPALDAPGPGGVCWSSGGQDGRADADAAAVRRAAADETGEAPGSARCG
ncbi:hypothetical protein SANTM175S_09585 [Streptomyces antimycoticus]